LRERAVARDRFRARDLGGLGGFSFREGLFRLFRQEVPLRTLQSIVGTETLRRSDEGDETRAVSFGSARKLAPKL
jgi:hypothetical protein